MVWRLRQPPRVTQGTGYKCWAAALECWLGATPDRPSWDQEFLLKFSKWYRNSSNKSLPDGAINAEIFKEMATEDLLGLYMEWYEVPKGQSLGDELFHDYLSTYGYLFLSYTLLSTSQDRNGGIRHCVVIWAADRAGNVNVMNPSSGAYENKTTDDFTGPFLIAYRPAS
ncbi:hypothetical protein [Falsiroseomonas selenitidurans]|uniref:Peptidase C39-like domain-containing protein n=1 Tax=Falsiroseomonas selenitidurans TaxID=2716335 RepID=A0ABX1E6K3_9PROT|nr:hypothetical protein [Falsiroseomonas selenitidurans]NKC32822.1 hypothetical protein [Falsiroseomonas selenitidurans]